MDKERTCGNCRFWVPDYPEPGLDNGRCHIRAPQVVYGLYGTAAAFPEVRRDQWCGEHQPNNQENANG